MHRLATTKSNPNTTKHLLSVSFFFFIYFFIYFFFLFFFFIFLVLHLILRLRLLLILLLLLHLLLLLLLLLIRLLILLPEASYDGRSAFTPIKSNCCATRTRLTSTYT